MADKVMSKVQELAMYHQVLAVVVAVHEQEVHRPMWEALAQQVKDLLVEIAVHMTLTILEVVVVVLAESAVLELAEQLAVTVELAYNLVLVEPQHIMQVVAVDLQVQALKVLAALVAVAQP